MRTGHFAQKVLLAGAVFAVAATVGDASGDAGAGGSAQSAAIPGANCTQAQKGKRLRALRAYKAKMGSARRAYFRRHRSAKARKAFVKSQKAKLEALERAAGCTLTSTPPPPLDGFGTIAGTSGVVAPELDKPTPSLFGNTSLDFGDDPYDDPEDRPLLTPGGQSIVASGNAGGSALLSEVFAFEMLARFERASLLKTETEIVYDQPGATTDLLVGIAGRKVGVSVMRAVTFPFGAPYSLDAAKTLLTDKLDGINGSSQSVSATDEWVKQVLVVMADDQQHADTIQTAWRALDDATKTDTIVYVIVTEGSDMNIYANS